MGSTISTLIAQLPQPSALAQQHSEVLQAHIAAEIQASAGKISFARFMELALYAPGLGYYVSGNRKFGPQGDFITAPEVSSLFGRCLARQCAQVFSALSTAGSILEFGAGTGIMAADILLELSQLRVSLQHYYILEVSPELRERQQQTIQQHAPEQMDKVVWLNRLPEPGFQGVIIANELLDALPVHRFMVQQDGLQELVVAFRDEQFTWETAPAAKEMHSAVEALRQSLGEPLRNGYVSEISLAQSRWMHSIAERLGEGAILLIDYGYPQKEYYHPQRDQGTLMCHYRQRAHEDPFVYIGLQDITSYVDFSGIAAVGVEAGLRLAGFTSQAHFLIGCGLDEILAQSDPEDVQNYLPLTQQVKRLTLPGEMGERFKAIGFTRNCNIPLRGFDFSDQRDRL